MKYRKDRKAEIAEVSTEPPKSRVDEFIDEVVDIHKTAYADIRDAVVVTFEEIKDFDELKKKVNEFVEAFHTEFDAKVAEITAE